MTLTLRNIFLFFSLTLFFSCETVVDLEFEEDSKLAIHSLFTPGDVNTNNPFDVLVFHTKSIISSDDLEFASEADVTITPTDEEERVLSYFESDSPLYRSFVGPEEGRFYELHVSKEGYDPIIAKSFVPIGVEIENLEINDVESFPHEFLPNESEYNFNLQFEIEDDGAEENYYHLTLWRVILPSALNGYNRPTYISMVFDKEETVFDPSVQIVNNSQAFYGAHINDETFNGTTKKFDFDIAFRKVNTTWPENILIEAELKTVSKEYYNYQIEGSRYEKGRGTVLFNDPNVVSNNIENGYGVFAGYALRRVRANIQE